MGSDKMRQFTNQNSYVRVIFLVLICVGSGYAGITPRRIQFQTGEDQLKVASFNIRVGKFCSGSKAWSNRRDMVITLLAGERSDVVGLQEALDFQLEEIHQALPQYEVYAIGRGDEKDEGETCAILYRKDRFLMVDSGTMWFSNTPWEPGSKFFGTLFPRICSWVRLADLETARCFYVYNLHLDSLSQSAREKSVRILARQISLRKHLDPFVVMGDFNMELHNPAMMYLQQFDYKTPYPRLQDTWAKVHPFRLDEGTYHKFRGKTTGPKIDHILVGKDCKVLAAGIDKRGFNGHYPSDHFAVSAVVELW